jgi:hypothetical protein
VTPPNTGRQKPSPAAGVVFLQLAGEAARPRGVLGTAATFMTRARWSRSLVLATRPKRCLGVRGMSALLGTFQGGFATMRHEKNPLFTSFRRAPFSWMTKPISVPRWRARRKCGNSFEGIGMRARRLLVRRAPGALKLIQPAARSTCDHRPTRRPLLRGCKP